MSLLKCHRGPVFVIIRFPYDLTLTCKNALMKTLSIHNNYCGCISGITTSLRVIEGSWPGTMGVAILTFKGLREAELWKDSVPEIKQPDWLRGVDMLIVPVRHIPAPTKNFVQILDLCIYDLPSFEHNYACEAKEVLNYWGACAGVVSSPSDSIHKVKGLWDPNYLIINFWPSCQVFEEAMKSGMMTSVAFFKCCFMPPQPPRKRIIDRGMIGLPTNFQHTGHIGSNDINRDGCFLEGAQNQMQTKGGYSTSSPILSHLKLIDLQPITIS